jgi:hypothetical protein
MRGSILAATALLILSAVDAFFTGEGIKAYGTEIEMNPIMKNLIESQGIWCLYAFKAFFMGILMFTVWKIPEEKLPRVVVPSLWLLVGAYSVVVLYGFMLWSSI